MSYTKAEIEQIKENLKKIEMYVKEYWIPRLRKYDSISVEFGKLKRTSFWDTRRECVFGFNYDGDIYYRRGGLSHRFIPESQYPFTSIYDNWMDAKDLLLYWQQVKRLIEDEFANQERERAALTQFEV